MDLIVRCFKLAFEPRDGGPSGNSFRQAVLKHVSKGMIPRLVNLKNPSALYLFVALYGLYWVFFPTFTESYDTAYSLLLLIFIYTASLFWGLSGGLIFLASVFVIRIFTTVSLHLPYYGGPFSPIVGLASVLVVGGLSDYVTTLENRIQQEYQESPFIPPPLLRRSTAFKDSIILIFICAIVLSISSYYDLMEAYYKFSQEFEQYELDEYIILLLVLVIYAGIYSYRRWYDLNRELVNRRVIEQELQRSENRYKSIVNNANAAIGVFRDGKTLFINPYAQEAIGLSEDEMIGRSFLELIHPDDREMAIRYNFDRVAGEEVPDDYLVRLMNKNGKIFWTRVSSAPIDWEGEAATLNFLKDVTEIVRAEDDLKKALSEKDILLKEIHHRVKNNMQIISSLLNLQISRETDAAVIGPLKESQNRVFCHGPWFMSNFIATNPLPG